MKRVPFRRIDDATSAMTNDTVLPFLFPAVQRKKIMAAVDGGCITSHGGVMLLAVAERRLVLSDDGRKDSRSSRCGARASGFVASILLRVLMTTDM